MSRFACFLFRTHDSGHALALAESVFLESRFWLIFDGVFDLGLGLSIVWHLLLEHVGHLLLEHVVESLFT